MKALSLTQPWATLVAIGAKKIETRSWRTSHRGPLAIHASAGFPREARELCDTEPFRTALSEDGIFSWKDLPTGVVVAIVEVLACKPTWIGLEDAEWIEGLSEREWHFGDYGPERFGWFLDLTKRIEPPVPARGSLGLWEWEPGPIWAPKPKPEKPRPQLEMVL